MRAVVVGACLYLPSAFATVLADDIPAGEATSPPVSRPAPGEPEVRADGFLPISKLVPRAKIVLADKERLPDRGGEKTFAAFGRTAIDYPWWQRQPVVPMYPFAYHPIYIEDMNLERCGWSFGCWLQPVISGMHFYGSIGILPYKVLVSPPCSYVYPPGECPPGWRFSYCENYLGPPPKFGWLFGRRASGKSAWGGANNSVPPLDVSVSIARLPDRSTTEQKPAPAQDDSAEENITP